MCSRLFFSNDHHTQKMPGGCGAVCFPSGFIDNSVFHRIVSSDVISGKAGCLLCKNIDSS